MQKRFIGLAYMYNEVSACLHRNAAKYEDFIPLNNALESLDEQINLLQQLGRDVEQEKKGYALDKNSKRKQLALLTDVMRTKIRSVALSHNDEVAYINSNITSSEILYKSALVSINNAEIILILAKEISVNDRALFQISDDDIIELEQAIKSFGNARTLIRSTIVIKQTSGELLADRIRATANFVRQNIANLMGNLRIKEPVFYKEFMNAKAVINLPSHHAQITGAVTDGQHPLRHVKVTASNRNGVYEDMTDLKGRYKIPLSPELYKISFELDNYSLLVLEDVLIDRAERLEREVVMRKVER